MDVHAEVPSSVNPPHTDRVEASTQIDNSVDLKRLLDVLMEIRGQIYALGCEFQNMQNVNQATSISLHDQVQALNLQDQATAKSEELVQLKKDLRKLEETIQSMGDFQLVRIPKQS